MMGLMDIDSMRAAWQEDGYFFLRSLIAPSRIDAILTEVVETIRSNPPASHVGEVSYFSGSDYLIFPEVRPSPAAVNPEDRVAKVFSCHMSGASREIAEHPEIVAVVTELLGRSDIDCFQSQFILKNPGVIGQPWHQDAYYFRFDRQPQVGVWLALGEATLENGCLWVTPGSHRDLRVFHHVPDRRPAAVQAYMEIVDQDVSNQVPAVMHPGDVLFFHSYLMHRSTDNVADTRRAAMVYHYAEAGTKAVSSELERALCRVNRWLPVRRTEPAA
jgi:ectoine hydroxylase-related dioxygenase (phytanoyl-CoA dioxygenase family)